MNLAGPYKDAIVGLAAKVALALNTPIVLPAWLVQVHADPCASSERRLTDKQNLAQP